MRNLWAEHSASIPKQLTRRVSVGDAFLSLTVSRSSVVLNSTKKIHFSYQWAVWLRSGLFASFGSSPVAAGTVLDNLIILVWRLQLHGMGIRTLRPLSPEHQAVQYDIDRKNAIFISFCSTECFKDFLEGKKMTARKGTWVLPVFATRACISLL